jgi:penicillin-binding protein 2
MKSAIRTANVFLALLLSYVLALPLNAAAGAAAPRATRGSRRGVPARYRGVPTFADSTKEDVAAFDDPVVRQAAVDALGRYNGTVVATDPNTGRILAIVNQKLAFSSGFIPCSTIKPTIALAALEENIIRGDTLIKISRRRYMSLTEAMAHSNNEFFEELGRRMGFDTVSRYGRLMGLGELAGYGLPEEQPGSFPLAPPQKGGVARMSSYGEGIQMTPLQLAALTSALANGGTLYYLQYPRTAEDRDQFTPRIKRKLDIEPLLPEIREGMLAAVLYGTGKASYDREGDEQALGKTGTCSDEHAKARIGWFTSYADEIHPKISLVVFLQGNTRRVKGPMAAVVAGRIYRTLREKNYFAKSSPSDARTVALLHSAGAAR